MATFLQALPESGQRPWAYGSNHTPGSLRLLSVPSLLTSKPTIELSEWRNLRLASSPRNIPRYAAVSHCWTPSPSVAKLAEQANRPLDITIEDAQLHRISWHGLCQAAFAARHLGCEYLWLDFICLHQTSSLDKKLQIENMGHIYSRAKAVIVMPGGVAAAQDARDEAYWIERAWTLQEATLCPNTHALVLHPELGDVCAVEYSCSTAMVNYNVQNIRDDLALSTLSDLLSIRGGVSLKVRHRPDGPWIEREYSAACFGKSSCGSEALLALLAADNDAMRKSAVWRCLWLRTSKKEQDMVFSVMHLLGLKVEIDYGRSLEDLILELARKSASQPWWLDIGDKMAVHPRSGLLPALPVFQPHKPPVYLTPSGQVAASQYVNIGGYTRRFDIKILTPVDIGSFDGDLVCATIFSIDELGSAISGAAGSHVMVIGDQACDMHSAYDFIGPKARFLRRLRAGTWEVFGNGTM
ncbi:hypothetical protein OQA88_8430 [Cercophora sp. LCS_1]